MKNKIIAIIVLIALIISMGSFTVDAHSPSSMSLDRNKTTGGFNVTITHEVDDKSSHYIEEIVIKKNGEEIKSETYTSQPTDSTFTYTYQIDAEEGDELEVSASCSIGGNIQKTVEITEEGSEQVDGGGIPGFTISLLIASIIIVVYFKKER